ncbi:hypothetical protein ACT691_20400 [Vibrio metschnikovii]
MAGTGTLCMESATGHAAEQGQSLVMVAEAAQVAIQRTVQYWRSTSSCRLPGETAQRTESLRVMLS